ncbi:MAG: hypothetical protein ACRDD2_08540 [Sarcina sp.]
MRKSYKALIAIIICVGGFFIIKESIKAIATDKTPNVTATITGYDGGFKNHEISTFNNGTFDLLLEINGGLLKDSNLYENNEYLLKGISLTVSNLVDFEIVSVKRKDLIGKFYELNWNDKKIDCGELEYNNVAVAPTMDIKITLRAKKSGIYNKDNKSLLNNFKVNYKDIKTQENIVVDTTLGDINGHSKDDLIVTVNDYEIDNSVVTFNSEKSGNHLKIPSGTTIPMVYNLEAPVITVNSINAQNEENQLSKDLIYVIQGSSLDEVVEDKTIREILIESLEKVSEKNIYLMIYNKSATIKEIDGRNRLTVNEAIEILKNEETINEEGNLAEALMKIQATIDKEKINASSAFLITNGKPYYYLEKNGQLIREFDLKENITDFDEKKAIENTKVIAKEIAEINSNNKIRWNAINLGVKSEITVTDEIIEILNGEAISGEDVTIENISNINNEVIADIIVQYKLTASENKDTPKNITIEPESKEGVIEKFYYKYNKSTDENHTITLLNTDKNNKEVELNVKITKIYGEQDSEIDLLKVVDTSYQCEIIGKEDSESEKIKLDYGNNEIYVTAIELFESRVGLFNGKKKDVLNSQEINIDNFKNSTFQYVGTGKDQLDEVVQLSIDNYFTSGILLSPNEDIEIKGVDIKSSELVKGTDIKNETYIVYKLTNNGLEPYSNRNNSGNYILKKSENDEKAIYLIALDFNILTNDQSKINKIAKVGVNIGIVNQEEVQDSFVGLNIRTTAKPEHY